MHLNGENLKGKNLKEMGERFMILKKGLQGLVSPHPGTIYMYITNIKRSSLKPLGQSKPNLI